MRIGIVRIIACMIVMVGAVAAQVKSDRAIEERIVQYLREHVKPYKLAKNLDEQLIWMKPAGSKPA